VEFEAGLFCGNVVQRSTAMHREWWVKFDDGPPSAPSCVPSAVQEPESVSGGSFKRRVDALGTHDPPHMSLKYEPASEPLHISVK